MDRGQAGIFSWQRCDETVVRDTVVRSVPSRLVRCKIDSVWFGKYGLKGQSRDEFPNVVRFAVDADLISHLAKKVQNISVHLHYKYSAFSVFEE